MNIRHTLLTKTPHRLESTSLTSADPIHRKATANDITSPKNRIIGDKSTNKKCLIQTFVQLFLLPLLKICDGTFTRQKRKTSFFFVLPSFIRTFAEIYQDYCI
jgi:hypothetical protein